MRGALRHIVRTPARGAGYTPGLCSRRDPGVMNATHLIVLATLVAAGATSVRSQTPVVAFTNVTVIPMDRERSLPDHTVVVQGDRIATVGPASEVEAPWSTAR